VRVINRRMLFMMSMSFSRLHVGSRAWNGSWNGSFDSPSVASAVNVIFCGIRAAN
jgi:hypothetical protein